MAAATAAAASAAEARSEKTKTKRSADSSGSNSLSRLQGGNPAISTIFGVMLCTLRQWMSSASCQACFQNSECGNCLLLLASQHSFTGTLRSLEFQRSSLSGSTVGSSGGPSVEVRDAAWRAASLFSGSCLPQPPAASPFNMPCPHEFLHRC